jgi:DNA-binding response OmpR family regulator
MTTILIVEDDDAIRSNVMRLLKLEGYDVVSATNGRLGLEQVRAVRPDLVISDVSMPEMDGFELLEAIRADSELAATSVMLLTALDDRASMRRGMTAGADDYLAKRRRDRQVRPGGACGRGSRHGAQCHGAVFRHPQFHGAGRKAEVQ